MAEAWFNLFAQGWGEAQSCGTMPASRLDVFAVIAMAEAGIDIASPAFWQGGFDFISTLVDDLEALEAAA